MSTVQKFGLRPYDVTLVWIRWSGSERGAGKPKVLREVQMIPAPEVIDLTGVSMSPVSVGILPVGSVRLQKVSSSFTADDLRGLTVPARAIAMGCGIQRLGSSTAPNVLGATSKEVILARGQVEAETETIPEPYEFFYEISEACVKNASRLRFRPASMPFRRPGQFDWTIVLEKISEDRTRAGRVAVPEER